MVKFSFKPIDKSDARSKVRDTAKDYVLAQVNKTTRNQKILAGRAASWGDEKKDVHAFIQLVMETCHNAKLAGNLTDEAMHDISWLAVQCQEAIDNEWNLKADALMSELQEWYAEVRLSGGITAQEQGPEVVIPPPQLNPAFNPYARRPPSDLGVPQPASDGDTHES